LRLAVSDTAYVVLLLLLLSFDYCLQLWGLRRFRIPLRTNFQQPNSPTAALEQENTIR
jgi:hypothetical protein